MARKSGAIAASLSAQILFTGVLTLVPLAYQEVLPIVRQSIPLAGPDSHAPASRGITPAQQQQQESSATPYLRSPSHPFIAPKTVPTTSAQQIVDTLDSPPPVVPMTGSGLFSRSLFGETLIPRTEVAAAPPEPKPVATVKPDGPPTCAIGGNVLAAKLIKKVVPAYPALARRGRRISGTVHLEGIVSKDGTIRNLQVIKRPPLAGALPQ